ncbi:ABC transporter substrate-binding protein [Microbacterium sp. LWH7-1.2]|uniref:ABC transporter substrate-binding protein n=1 Tax=Microbacterium sp. LWH7-1.2 TaxID=3135257 RepID=UPI0031392549
MNRHTYRAAVPIAILAVVLTGCTSSPQPSPTFTSTDLTVLTPEATGNVDSVTWGLSGNEPTTLDPILVGTIAQNTVVSNLCEGLMQVQPDFSVDLGLAESYDQPSPEVYVFHVRPDVQFWNGQSLTADDVAFSLNRNLDPASGAVNGYQYAPVQSIEATGPLDVTVTLSEPNADVLAILAGMSGAISQRSAVEAAGADYGTPAGGLQCTGPYTLGQWTSGQGIEIVANDNYWNPDLTPRTRTVHFDAIVNNNTLTSALLSGDLDGAYAVPAAGISALSKGKGALYFGDSTQYFLFGPVDPSGPASDARVREALSLAIDRESFVDRVLGGAGAPMKGFVPPFAYAGNPASAALLSAYDELPGSAAPDIEAATKLIEEANLSDTSLTIAITAGDQTALAAATLMQGAGTEIGLDMTIEQLQDTQVFDLFFTPEAREDVDLLATSGYYETPIFRSYTGTFVNPDGLVNFIGYDDPDATANLRDSLTATDPEQSAQSYIAGQDIWQDAYLTVPVATQYERLYLRDGLTGVPATQAYVSYPWAALLGATS